MTMSNDGSPGSPPTTGERRSLRATRTPRTFYAPEPTPTRTNSARQSSQPVSQQPNVLQLPQTNGINGAVPHFQGFQTPSTALPIARPVSTPRTAPHEFLSRGRKRNLAEAAGYQMTRIGAGHTGTTVMNRIIMSLKSGIETEINYALNQLVQISYQAGDELRNDHYPGLAGMLFDKIAELEELHSNTKLHGKNDCVDHAEYTSKMDRILNAGLILRNMSLLQDNAVQFADMRAPKEIATMVLQLPYHPNLVELKGNMLDMVEAMAHEFQYNPADPLLDILVAGIDSHDRGVLIGSLRALIRYLMGRDEANRIGQTPPSVVLRICSLLMIEDEELLSACLDFLYQYTTNEENVATLLSQKNGVETVRQLIRLLVFQGITGEQLVYVRSHRKQRPPIAEIPLLPPEIVNDLLNFTEPERATKWMRCTFEEDPDSDITQIQLWQAYQNRFTEFQHRYPLLPAAEFIKNVSVAFASASAMVLPNPAGGQKFIIKGIRARDVPVNTAGKVYLACKWHTFDPNSGLVGPRCKQNLASPQELWNHVLTAHLPPPPPDAIEQHPLLVCRWNNCGRFSAGGERDRRRVVAHVRCHMPDGSGIQNLPKEEQDMMEDPFGRVIISRCQTHSDEKNEPVGVPLASALVLGHVRRRGGELAREILKSKEEELFNVMALNKTIAGYVTNLLLED